MQQTLNSLVWYAGLYAISAAALRVAAFALSLLLARALSVDEYAGWGLLYSLQTGLATFCLAGVMEAVVGLLRSHRTVEGQRRLFGAANDAFLVTGSASALVGVIVYLVYLRGDTNFHIGTLVSVVTSGALLGYASLQAQIVRLEERHLASLYFNLVVPAVGLLGSGIAFLLERDVTAFFIGSAVGLALATLFAPAARLGFFGHALSANDTYAILTRIAPFVAVALFGWLSGYGNNYIVARFFAPEQVARFTFTFTLAAVMQLVATAMNQVWSPRFYRHVHDLPFEQLEARNLRVFQLQGIALGAIGAVLIVCFGPALRWIGGNLVFYSSATLEVTLLVAAYVLLTPWWHSQNYFLVHDRGREIMRVVVVTGVIGTIIWIALMWLMGPIGIYLGFLVQMALRASAMVVAARRHWAVRIAWSGVAIGLVLTGLGYLVAARWNT